MPISSGKYLSVSRMVKDHQYFPIGEGFWYAPLCDPDMNMFICAIELPKDGVNDVVNDVCGKLCCLDKYCMNPGNSTSNGRNWIPQCSMFCRKDGKSVYFKQI